MDTLLRTLEKIIPKKIYKLAQPIYHYALTFVGAIIYRFPARKIKIIGVTGTKGKSSTVEILNSIFETAGYKTAISGTIRFKIGDQERPNKYKMSMPGRFFMQKFIYDAVQANCDIAIIEMTSEGSKQFRHKFIYTDVFIFTNLSPEHIESHGSFKKYKDAKIRMVKNLKKKGGFLIVNGDSEHSKAFIDKHANGKHTTFSLNKDVQIEQTSPIRFSYKNLKFSSPLVGEFNIKNILAAYEAAKYFNVPDEKIIEGVAKLSEVKGRAQFVPNTKGIDIVIDYAHTPDSLEAIYKAFEGKKIIGVLGSTGGGRDKWKRPRMGAVANKYCNFIILTDDDPYDEDPIQIVNDMKTEIDPNKLIIEIDRAKAIKMALTQAKTGDVVLITGKGTDPYLMKANGIKEPWSDLEKVKEVLKELK